MQIAHLIRRAHPRPPLEPQGVLRHRADAARGGAERGLAARRDHRRRDHRCRGRGRRRMPQIRMRAQETGERNGRGGDRRLGQVRPLRDRVAETRFSWKFYQIGICYATDLVTPD